MTFPALLPWLLLSVVVAAAAWQQARHRAALRTHRQAEAHLRETQQILLSRHQAFEEQHRLFELVLQSLGEAVITTDPAGRVVLLNPSATQMTGLATVAGRPLAEVLRFRHESSGEPCTSTALDLLRDPASGSSAHTCLLLGPDGTERLVTESASLLRAPDGTVAGAVLTLREVTRERAAEAARAANLESLGQMAGHIAHDFGNLLAAIAAHVQLAQLDETLAPVPKRRLDEIDRLVWRARDVIRQLTSFARVEEPQKRPLPLAPLLREAAAPAIQNSPVRLVTALADDLWSVVADDTQLAQVIHHLAVNAVHAMPVGGTLTLRARNLRLAPSADSAATRTWVEIAVIDTGTGIVPEHLSKIFDPFFSTKPKGNGLGLATCDAIIRKHGGQLRVESAVGRGTTFHLRLPAVAAAPPAAPARHVRGRVLVATPDARQRDALRLMLGLLHYESTEADTLSAALDCAAAARAASHPFSSIFLDAALPGTAGGILAALPRIHAADPSARAALLGVAQDAPMTPAYRQAGFVIVGVPAKLSALETALRELQPAPEAAAASAGA